MPPSKSKVEYLVDSETGCWIWQRTVDRHGYGLKCFANPARSTGAHKYMWEKLRSPVPLGMVMDHLCRNRKCVNPEHLRVVTPAENSRCSSFVKLIPDQVLWMREKQREGWSYSQLAREFNIHTMTAYNAVAGVTWKGL